MNAKQKECVDRLMKDVYRNMERFRSPKDQGMYLVMIRNIINCAYAAGVCDGTTRK